MKYQVTGQHKQTGARMTLEFEADSRAAADRKATKSGMDVRHVEEIGPSGNLDLQPSIVASYRPPRRVFPTSGRLFFWLIVLGLVIAAYYNRDEIIQEIHMLIGK